MGSAQRLPVISSDVLGGMSSVSPPHLAAGLTRCWGRTRDAERPTLMVASRWSLALRTCHVHDAALSCALPPKGIICGVKKKKKKRQQFSNFSWVQSSFICLERI